MGDINHKPNPNLYICTDNFGVSGVTTQVYYMARGMAALGWEVHIICYSTAGNYFQAFQRLPVKIHAVDTFTHEDYGKFYTFKTQDTIDISNKVIQYLNNYSIFNTNKPGIIILNYMLSMFFLLDKIPPNIGRVFTLHSDEKFYYKLLQHFYPLFDGITACSDYINSQAKSFLKSVNSCQPNAAIPYGIEIPLTLKDYKLRVIYSGRLVEYQKRIFDIIEIGNLLKKWNVPFHLTLVGDESNRSTLAQRIHHLGLEDCVSIIGPLNNKEVIEQLKMHDVFLQVSEFEGLSLSLLEAIANGVIPVVSKISSGVAEIIEHGVNGFLVERGDIQGFASILRDLASCFHKFNNFRQSARQAIINKGCSAEAMASLYARFFDRVLSFNHLNYEHRLKRRVDLNFALEEISPQSNVKLSQEKPVLTHPAVVDSFPKNQVIYIQAKPTITFFIDGMHVGGVQTFVRHMVLGLNKFGWNARIAIYVNNRYSQEVTNLENQGVPIIPFYYTDEYNQHLSSTILSTIGQDSKGIVIPNYISQIYNSFKDLPPNLLGAHIFHADEPYYYKIFRQNVDKLKAAVAVSQVCYQKALDTLNQTSASLPLERIPYGVQMNSTWQERRYSQTLRIIYSGRIIEHQKCIFEIPELASLAKRRGLSCQWSLVGDGADAELLQHRIHSLRVEDCVHLLGTAPPNVLSHLLNEHDVIVLTSEYEGLPLALLEAMGHGCVPIVYDIPSGIHEVIKHEYNGFIVPYNDREKFVASLALISCNADVLRDMSYHAWTTVYPAYSVDTMVSRYVKFFNEVLFNHDS